MLIISHQSLKLDPNPFSRIKLTRYWLSYKKFRKIQLPRLKVKQKGKRRIEEKRTGKRNVHVLAIFKQLILSKLTEPLGILFRSHVRIVVKY